MISLFFILLIVGFKKRKKQIDVRIESENAPDEINKPSNTKKKIARRK